MNAAGDKLKPGALRRCLELFFHAVRRLIIGFALLAGAAVLGMMGVTVADVVLRVFKVGIVGAYDIVRICGVVAAGCFIDALALILLTIPIFYPVVLELGYNPVWFGVMVVVVTQMGVITPPVGMNVYVVSGIERGIPLQSILKDPCPFS